MEERERGPLEGMGVMSVEQILIREFHLRFPNTRSIAASVNAGDGRISVNVDGEEWIMSAARPDDGIVFCSGSKKITFPFPDDWPAEVFAG
jgi:chemotaxis protein histidine kinase CheA